MQGFPILTIVYNLINPILNKIFNCNTFVFSINADAIQGNMIVKDQNMWTKIIETYLLVCKILCKCPKFKESKCNDFEKAKTSIAKGVVDCINSG